MHSKVPMNKLMPDLDEMLAVMQQLTGFGALSLSAISSENKRLLAEIDEFDPLRLASSFSGLLTVPELQSNCIRLETLVHLALAQGQGRRKPSDKIVARLFNQLGDGSVGRQEDPAEDVFVSLIATPRGNFRVLEGVWEAAGFYLQRVVNAIELIPAGPRYDHMRECVYALLRLSDLVCERAGLAAYQLGNTIPEEVLPKKILEAAGSLRRRVKFVEADLSTRGISINHLAEFGFPAASRLHLMDENIGHSKLERYPIAHRNGEVFLLLPTAVTVAIRRYVVEQMEAWSLRETFVKTLAHEYATLFADTPLLGKDIGAPIQFQRAKNGVIASVMKPADRGLFINFVFFVDMLEEFEERGLVGTSRDPEPLADDVDTCIDGAYEAARKVDDFREMLTLVVGCGVGRGILSPPSLKKREHWRLECLSAADLLTLSWLPDFEPLSLWRLFDGQKRLQELGVELQNINGLLNMVAWMRSLGGHLVPHGHLPDDFGASGASTFIMIEQNALRKVRHESAIAWNPHAVMDVDGKWRLVRKDGQDLFEEDRHQPFFMTDEETDGEWPAGIYETPLRPWWVRLEKAEGTAGFWAYERSKMLKTWLCRTAPVLEPKLPMLPAGPLLLSVRFEGRLGDRNDNGERRLLTFADAKAAISASADVQKRMVALVVGEKFEEAIFHPENIAERALVESIVESFNTMAGASLDPAQRSELTQIIVPDTSARQSHAFMAQTFRDFVRRSVPRSPIIVDADDTALFKLGLGWRVRDRSLGGMIEGKESCTAFLNDVVRLLEDELCEDLRHLDREAIIWSAVANHESAINDRDNWARTAAAVLSLHADKDATLQTMSEHDFKLNGAFQASRLLVEFAICECPLEGGRKPGQLELSRLMAKTLIIQGMGGWSDAIRWEAMQPTLRVTPLGDIHAKLTFHEEVLAPYGRAGSDLRIKESVENYAENLVVPEGKPTDWSMCPPEFWDAWQEEFGASFDETRKFLDFVDELGRKEDQAVLKLTKSVLLDAQLDGEPLAREAVNALVERMTFRSRPGWRSVPEGYDEKDRHPWRFRRRLSMLRKPLLQLDEAEDPTMLIAPGILRDATAYMFWPAAGSEDTELGVMMEPEVCHGETKVYTRVQA
jgi:hypothetical protein